MCSQLDLLILQQTANQLGAWVFCLLAFSGFLGRQQHARLDLNQHGRHQQVFGRQLQVGRADLVHIGQVLPRDGRHGNVQNIEILLTDQVKQQVQRAFKGLEKHLQGIRRNVQVVRHRKERLAVEFGQCHLVDHLWHVWPASMGRWQQRVLVDGRPVGVGVGVR